MCQQGSGGVINVPIAGGLHTENWRQAMCQHVLPGECAGIVPIRRCIHFSVLQRSESLTPALYLSAPVSMRRMATKTTMACESDLVHAAAAVPNPITLQNKNDS